MGFLELRRQCGVSHEVRRGAQGASRVAPGKSGLHVFSEKVGLEGETLAITDSIHRAVLSKV